MLNALLLIAKILLDTVSSGLQKKYQLVKPEGTLGYAAYSMIIGILSLFLYSAAGKFQMHVNAVTLRYTALYAIIVAVGMVLPFIVLKYTNLLMSSLFSRTGSLIMILLFSSLYLKESFSVYSVIGAVLMVTATLLPMLPYIGKSKNNWIGFVFGTVMAFFGGLGGILNKLYVADSTAEGSNGAYCFYINVFLVGGWIIFLAGYLLLRHKKKDAPPLLSKFSKKAVFLIILISIVSAAGTLFNLYLISFVSLSYYTVITSSAGLVTVALLSKFLFKENINRLHIISIVLAIGSIVLSSM